MIANQQLLTTFLSQNKTQFVIPVYQRNYDWSLPQCSQLLSDIIEVGSKKTDNHFIGSIVYIQDGIVTSAEVRPLVVIDGQQRLTTITLLFLAIQNYAAKNGQEEKAAEITDTYLQNKYVKNENNKLKLKQSASNYAAFKHIADGQNPDTFQGYSGVIENYRFFISSINADNFETILNGVHRLLFVEVALERGKDDPQRIFESLNSTGLDLSQADLIRNYILMGLEPEMQERVYNEHWSQIEIHARETEQQENRVSDFIRDYLTIKTKKIPNKGKVYEEFKKRFKERGDEFYKDILPELKQFSIYYNRLINPERNSDKEIRAELSHIKRLEIEVAYPFLLQVYRDYDEKKIDQAIFVKVIRLIQTYVWRRFMLGLPPGALNKVFMTLYSDVDTTNYLYSLEAALVRKKGTQKFPTDREIAEIFHEKDLYNIRPKNRDYLFYKLENHHNPEVVNTLSDEITVEHIFPQTPDVKWESELSQSDYVTIKEKYLHTIGNLTLTGSNSTLGNKTFSEKKVIPERGFNFSRLWINDYLKTTDKWNVETLKQRSDILLKRFYEIWPFPAVDSDENYDWDEDFTVYDAPDPKSRKLDYYIFKDEKIETSEFVTLYIDVLRKLFMENPELMLSEEIRSHISINTYRASLRQAAVLGGSYFVETNTNNQDKLRKLRVVLEKYNCAEELLINFANEEAIEVERDRSYWEARTSPEIMACIDQLFEIVTRLTPEATKNYNNSYIGVAINGTAQNYVVFAARLEHIRVEVLSADVASAIKKINAAGLSVLGVGKNSKRIKFRIAPSQFKEHEQLLHDLMEDAKMRYFS